MLSNYYSFISNCKDELLSFSTCSSAFTRNRKLSIVHTIGLILSMSFDRNRNGCAISAQKYFETLLPLEAPSRSSITEARSKIHWHVFPYLLTELNNKAPKPKWKGHRVFAIDGSKIKLPHTQEILKEFPQHLSHYPKGTLVVATDVLSGVIRAANIDQNYSSERDQLMSLTGQFEKNSILLLDRGFDGINVWNSLNEKGISFVARVRTGKQTSSFIKNFLNHGLKDAVVDVKVGDHQTLKLRLIRKGVCRKGRAIVVITNLIEKKSYKKEDVWGLYKKRWNIETTYYRMKHLFCLESYRSKKLNNVLQEVWANLIVLSLSSIFTYFAQLKLSGKHKINYKNCVEILSGAVQEFVSKQSSEDIFNEILSRLKKVVFIPQPGRKNPRISKQPGSTWCYSYKNRANDRYQKNKGWY